MYHSKFLFTLRLQWTTTFRGLLWSRNCSPIERACTLERLIRLYCSRLTNEATRDGEAHLNFQDVFRCGNELIACLVAPAVNQRMFLL